MVRTTVPYHTVVLYRAVRSSSEAPRCHHHLDASSQEVSSLESQVKASILDSKGLRLDIGPNWVQC